MISPLRTVFVASVILLCSSGLRASETDIASEEAIMEWHSVQVDCFETPETGRVSLSAQAGSGGITALAITAFGKKYSLSGSDLAKIKDYPLWTLGVTHEVGYTELGGHSVHVKFRRYSYDQAKKPIPEEVVVTVSKGQGLRVTTRTLQ